MAEHYNFGRNYGCSDNYDADRRCGERNGDWYEYDYCGRSGNDCTSANYARSCNSTRDCDCDCSNQSRWALLRRIMEEGFAVDEAILFLDVNPCDKQALAFYCEHAQKRRALLAKYRDSYGPLRMDDVNIGRSNWTWADDPMPWTREGNIHVGV